jgi:hypothetical protein
MQVFGVSPKTCFCLSKTNDTFLDQPMTVLERVRAQILCGLLCSCNLLQPLDLACVETQIGDGSPADCEILNLEGSFDVRLKLTR